jgi:hypothetical protein
MRAKTSTVDAATAARMLGRWSDPSTGFTTSLLTDEACFASEAEARAAWPVARRLVWATYHRFTVPAAATHFDGLSADSPAAVRDGWYEATFPLDDVLAALRRDRARLAAFSADDVAGAAAIADYLDMLRADFDIVEQTARTLTAARGDRMYPHTVCSATRYGDGGSLMDHTTYGA